MADHQEEFLRKYFHMAYKLSLPDILDQISELDKFSVRLCEKGFLTKDDLFKIIQASNPRMRKNVLHKILLGKEDYWLASPSDPDDSGVLAAICEMNASAADYTVVTVLEAFHHILDKVLDSDTPVQSSIFGGDSESRVCQDPDLDVHLRKLGYSLALPAILTHVKDLHVFCKTLFLSGVVTKEELDKFFPTSRQKVACFLMSKDEKAVFNCLANPTLTAKAESMKKKAYKYVVNVVLDPPQRPPDPSSVGRYALIGLASVGVGIAAIVSAPFVIAAAGFGSGGIVAGSFAAWFMSTYGGAVSAGSLCALLQSAGAAGLAASTTAGIGAAGSGASFGILSGIVAIIKKFKKKSERQRFRDNL